MAIQRNKITLLTVISMLSFVMAKGMVKTDIANQARNEELRRRALVTIVMYWNEFFMAKYRSPFIKTRCNILLLLHLVT